MTNWETWCPDPSDADPERRSQARRTSDIISMLVNIYGSKELFVNEYRAILSNRLLSHFTYDTDREIRHLELLKLRFGEAPLHQCEVMLKDIGDSKRINALLHASPESSPAGDMENIESDDGGDVVGVDREDMDQDENQPRPVRASSPVPVVGDENAGQQRQRQRRAASKKKALAQQASSSKGPLTQQPFPVNAVILSAQFWPQLKDETLELPPEVGEALKAYTKAFEAMKGNRTLVRTTLVRISNWTFLHQSALLCRCGSLSWGSPTSTWRSAARRST